MTRLALALVALVMLGTLTAAKPMNAETDLDAFNRLYCRAPWCQGVKQLQGVLYVYVLDGKGAPIIPTKFRGNIVAVEVLTNQRDRACLTFGRIMPGVC